MSRISDDNEREHQIAHNPARPSGGPWPIRECRERDCQEPGTILDLDSGPVGAILCAAHYRARQEQRAAREASWRRVMPAEDWTEAELRAAWGDR